MFFEGFTVTKTEKRTLFWYEVVVFRKQTEKLNTDQCLKTIYNFLNLNVSRYCDLFDEAPNHIFLRYGEKGMDHEIMVDNLLEVFADHGVEAEKREYIRKSLMSWLFLSWKMRKSLGNTEHTTKNSPVRQSLTEEIKRSPKHSKLFVEMFRYDYEIFGFEPFIKISR